MTTRIEVITIVVEDIENVRLAEILRVIRNDPKEAAMYNARIAIVGSTVGAVNAGDAGDMIGMSGIAEQSTIKREEVEGMLERMASAILAQETMDAAERQKALSLVRWLQGQVATEPQSRPKEVVKSVLGALAGTVSTAAGLAKVWETWGSALSKYFGM